MKKLLIAMQAGHTSTPALNRAKQLAKKGDIEVMLYSAVYDAQFAGSSFGDGTAMEGTRNAMVYAERQKLDGIRHELVGLAKSISAKTEWCEFAAEGIVNAAQDFNADLIVIGSRQHSLASRLLLDNTDWSVLQRTTIPVLVAHSREFQNYEQVMVALAPLQSSETIDNLSHEEIEKAQWLAGYFGGETHLTQVLPPEHVEFYERLTDSADLATTLRLQDLNAVAQLGPEHNIDAAHVHTTDTPLAQAIPEAANDLHADLVVLGLTPHTAAETFLVDSSTERVVDHLECDVLAVPQRPCQTVDQTAPASAFLQTAVEAEMQQAAVA